MLNSPFTCHTLPKRKSMYIKTPRLPSLHVNWRCDTVTVASILHHQRDVSSTWVSNYTLVLIRLDRTVCLICWYWYTRLQSRWHKSYLLVYRCQICQSPLNRFFFWCIFLAESWRFQANQLFQLVTCLRLFSSKQVYAKLLQDWTPAIDGVWAPWPILFWVIWGDGT